MAKKIMLLVVGIVLISGGVVYAKLKLKGDDKSVVGREASRQEQDVNKVDDNEKVSQQGAEKNEKQVVTNDNLDEELNSVSQELDQTINDLSDDLAEPETDLNL